MGNVADQVKFSELTLDMFRLLQTLEREPQDEMAQVDSSQLSHVAGFFMGMTRLGSILYNRCMTQVRHQGDCQ